MSVNVADAAVDAVISAINTNVSSYFDGMDGDGFTLADPKQVKKGPPNPLRMHSPSVYVFPQRYTQEDRYTFTVNIDVLYYLTDNDSERLGKRTARGADALIQLIEDNFSVTRMECDFDFGMSEGTQEGAAVISAEITRGIQ